MKSTAEVAVRADRSRASALVTDLMLVIGATAVVTLCARVYIPLPFTPVPLTLQNFAVLLVGLTLGPWRGAAAMALYLAEGLGGLPVFSPTGPGGFAQLIGPTGGYLMAYPAVAFISGWIVQRKRGSFKFALAGSALAECVLFAAGTLWLFNLTGSFGTAASFGLYPFVFAEVMKTMFAAAVGTRLYRR